jgi:hypothetical protein
MNRVEQMKKNQQDAHELFAKKILIMGMALMLLDE